MVATPSQQSLFLEAEEEGLHRQLAIDIDTELATQLAELLKPQDEASWTKPECQIFESVSQVDVDNRASLGGGRDDDQIAKQTIDRLDRRLKFVSLFFCDKLGSLHYPVALVAIGEQFEKFEKNAPFLPVDREIDGESRPDTTSGEAGKEGILLSWAGVMCGKKCLESGQIEWRKIESLGTGTDGREERVRSRRDKYDGRCRGWLLESLEERIGRLLTEPFGLIDNKDTLASFTGKVEDLIVHGPGLGNTDRLTVGNDHYHIAIAAFVDAAASRTTITTIRALLRNDLETVGRFGHGQGKLPLPHSGRAGKDECSPNLTISTLEKSLDDPFVPLISGKCRKRH